MTLPNCRVLSKASLARVGLIAALTGLLALQGSCGYSDGGGRHDIIVLGGALKPYAKAYGLIPTSEIVVPPRGKGNLPPLVDLRREGVVPPVQNQRWNSCIGWSLAYYVMTGVYAQHYKSLGQTLDVTNPENWFSPDYLYSQRDTLTTRASFDYLKDEPTCFETDGEVGCMRPERALELLLLHGLARWTWMCDGGSDGDLRLRPCGSDEPHSVTADSRAVWQLAETNAGWYRPRCYVRFGALNDLRQNTIESMQSWLHNQGTAIAVVVDMRTGWVTYRGRDRETVSQPTADGCRLEDDRGVCLDASGRDLGGRHMMTIIGYDRDFPSRSLYPIPENQQGSFLVVNQWGTKWGDRGYMWIPYAELQKIWVAGYGLIKGDGKNNSDNPICAQDAAGRWNNILEDDDVPRNQVPVSEAGDVCLVTTATALEGKAATGATTWTRSGWVGRVSCESKLQDFADWYVLTVDKPSVIDVTLRPISPPYADTDPNADPDADPNTSPCPDPEPDPNAPPPEPKEPLCPDAFTVVVSETSRDPTTGTITTRQVEQCVDGTRILELRIADSGIENIGREHGDGPHALRAFACAPGEYFIKVAPNVFDRFENYEDRDKGIKYELVVSCEPLPDACARLAAQDTVTEEEAAARQPITLQSDEFTDVLASASATDGSERKLFRVRVAKGRATRITLSGLAPGAHVELAAAHFDQPVPVLRTMWSRETSGGQDLQLTIPTDQQFSAVAIGIRNLNDAAATPYTLQIETIGLEGEVLPLEQTTCLEPPDVAHIASDTFQFDRSSRFALRPWWDFAFFKVREVHLGALSCSASHELRLTDDDGTILNDLPGFSIAELDVALGARNWRIKIPATFTETVWLALYDETGAPGRGYTLLRSREALLRMGIDGSPSDPNATPSQAVALEIGGPARDFTMRDKYPDGSDAHDWFRIVVPEGSKKIRVAFTNIRCGDGCVPDWGKFILSYWDGCGRRTVWFPTFDDSDDEVSWVLADLGSDAETIDCVAPTGLAYEAPIAGRTLYLMIEKIFPYPLSYTVEVTAR